MSFLYPRLVTVNRPGAQTSVGFQADYAGDQAVTETVIVAEPVPASIQARREGTKDQVGLPDDTTAPYWYVFIPVYALAKGVILKGDIVIDELGLRYQVVTPYWDSLGYRASTLLLNP